MNKTVTINVSGIIFHIEEDAYEKLSKYLGTIKSYFKDSEGRDEIMSDIESRIAELLKEKIGTSRQVVLLSDVDHVISVMGKPEDYAAEGMHETGEEKTGATQEETIDFKKGRRRVFRDPDDKVLGGVCGGIANYFDMDPLWLRLSLVFFTIFGGAGILVYIILWIVIPEAKTTAEKLEMKGEKVNINNIKKSVEEEMEHLKKKGKEMEEDVKNFSGPENRQKVKSGVDKFLEFLASVGTSFFRVFGKVLAVVLIIIGVIFTIGLFTSVFGVSNLGWNNSSDWLSVIFDSSGEYEVGVIALLLLLGVPFVMLIYAGFRLLLGIRERSRMINVAALLLWVIGLGLGVYTGVNLGTEFREVGKVREIYSVKTSSDTLFLKGITPSLADIGDDEADHVRIHDHGNNAEWEFMNIDGTQVRFGYPDLTIEKTEGDSFRIEVIRSARGYDKKAALNRARNIVYTSPSITDSLVEIHSAGSFLTDDKLRAQDVKVIIWVPVGKSVYLSKSIRHLVYDIPNVHDIYDGDMMNRTWVMTAEGLDCGKCEGLDLSGDEVRVGNGEVHIKNKKEEIHIQDGEIRIKEHKKEKEEKPDTVKGSSTWNIPETEDLFRVGVPFIGLGWGL